MGNETFYWDGLIVIVWICQWTSSVKLVIRTLAVITIGFYFNLAKIIFLCLTLLAFSFDIPSDNEP